MPTVENGYSLHDHAEGTSRKLDAPILRLELAKEVAQLQQGPKWNNSGQNAKTLVKSSGLRVVMMVLKRGASLGKHETVGLISLQTLEGRVRLKLPNDVVDLPVGVLLSLGGSVPHDLEAIDQSVVLLTIGWPATNDRVGARPRKRRPQAH